MARVLMLAYSCQPDGESEGAVGWELASRIARRHQVVLLTRPKHRERIEAARLADRTMDLTVEYHEMQGLRRLKRLGLPVSNLRYLAWNRKLEARVAELAPAFDLVHHTTWVRHWMPTAAATSGSTPFVWGPVGAAERPPMALIRSLGPRGRVADLARMAGVAASGLYPPMRRTWANTSHAVASSHDTLAWLRARGIGASLAPSVGHEREVRPRAGGQHFELLSVGRLLDWKGFHLVLRALATMPDEVRYGVVGEGPAERRLRRLAESLGIADRVEFLGRRSGDEVLELMSAAGVLAHPSLHDSGGFVVVEAMSVGLPVVCLDIGGPPYLAGTGGLPVESVPVQTLAPRLAAAFGRVLQERDAFSAAALLRAGDLTWESVVDHYDQVYDRVAGSQSRAM